MKDRISQIGNITLRYSTMVLIVEYSVYKFILHFQGTKEFNI